MLDFVCAQEPQQIIELFLNYDCDLDTEDLYDRLVNVLSRVAQGVASSCAGDLLPAQEATLQKQALESLVHMIGSMSNWAEQVRGMETAPEADPNASDEEEDEYDQQGLPCTPSPHVNVDELEASFDARRSRKKAIEAGLAKFSENAKVGLSYFEKVGFLTEYTPQGVAEFFHKFEGLNKSTIGQFIGRSKDFNKKVLHEFTDLFDFKGQSFDSAIRDFLQSFRLPGEAGMIDPIMEKFAGDQQFLTVSGCHCVVSFEIVIATT